MSADSLAYYRASLRLLKFVEGKQPTARRFGGEADALWSQFRGNLTTSDRIGVLLRDADAQWPGAFGARNVFQLRGVADDDAFGSQWLPLDGVDAEDLWREMNGLSSASAEDTLKTIAKAWDLELTSVALKAVSAAHNLVVAGPSAVAALIAHFNGRTDLNWADQVTVIATPPGHRQIAAAASAMLNLSRAATLADDKSSLTFASTTKPRLLLSTDATDADAKRASALAGQTHAG